MILLPLSPWFHHVSLDCLVVTGSCDAGCHNPLICDRACQFFSEVNLKKTPFWIFSQTWFELYNECDGLCPHLHVQFNIIFSSTFTCPMSPLPLRFSHQISTGISLLLPNIPDIYNLMVVNGIKGIRELCVHLNTLICKPNDDQHD